MERLGNQRHVPQPVMESIITAGAISGPPIGGLMYEILGYKGPFLLIALANGLSVVFGLLLIPSPRKQESGQCHL